MASAFLHQTDIFRPHNDPDDHWDLACAYALASKGLAELSGILIDHPPGPPILNHKSDPDLGSVAQLSDLTGCWPPVAVGCRDFYSARRDFKTKPPPPGVKFLLDQLRERELSIVIVGSARDVAEAVEREPELFARQCRGIYLNAGSGSPDPAAVKELEWNVKLDRAAYVKLWEARCPIFWLPCLQDEAGTGAPESREYASHYRFRQREILDDLPVRLRNYFGWMFTKEASSAWLERLDGDFSEILAAKGKGFRFMYSTASFFHLAGLSVTRDGEIVSDDSDPGDLVYRFEPIALTCGADAVTHWRPASGETNRFLFHVVDPAKYPAAMTRAMKTLLLGMKCSGNQNDSI